MRKGIFAAALSIGLAVSAFLSGSAYADGQKVVTLGADLTEEQKAAVLKYFGVYGQNIETLYITNQDERNHLGSYVPLEQIGTRTFSCALVNPTTSGGIRVKTANLSWVTSNMIATTLSTSGVVNCEVLAASPFEVSGTGALTGIIMAYESASGQTLQEEKKDIATQELITTGQIANQIGQEQATSLVNEIKMQVIENQVKTEPEIVNIINNVVSQQVQVSEGLSAEDYDLLLDLAERISEQDYDYDEMKETLQRVEDNVTNLNAELQNMQDEQEAQVLLDELEDDDFEDVDDEDEEEVPNSAYASDALPEDSILMQTDDTALGENVIMDATDEEALANVEDTAAAPEPEPAPADTILIPEASDETVMNAEPVEPAPVEPAPAETPEPQEQNAEDDFWNSDNSDDGWDVFDQNGENTDDQTVEQYQEEQNEQFQNTDEYGNVFEQNQESFDENTDQNTEDDFWNTEDQNTEDQNIGDEFTDNVEEYPEDDQNVEEDYENGEDQNMDEETPDEEDAEDEGGDEDEGSEDEGSVESIVIADTDMTVADAYENDAAGSRIVTVYVNSEENGIDIKEGTVVLTDASGAQTTLDLDDAPMKEIAEMEDADLASKGWQKGWVINVMLDECLDTDNSYEIEFNGTLVRLDENGDPVDGTEAEIHDHISVQTGSYGVDLMSDGYYHSSEGETTTAELIFPEEAVAAHIQITDEAVASVETADLDLASGETTFDLQLNTKGTTDFTIEFYDAEGNVLNTHTAFVTVTW